MQRTGRHIRHQHVAADVAGREGASVRAQNRPPRLIGGDIQGVEQFAALDIPHPRVAVRVPADQQATIRAEGDARCGGGKGALLTQLALRATPECGATFRPFSMRCYHCSYGPWPALGRQERFRLRQVPIIPTRR
jgi:hypothetical protein